MIFDNTLKKRNEEIINLYKRGIGPLKIAKRYKISRNRVYTIMESIQRDSRYTYNYGRLPVRYVHALAKADIISLKHAKLLGINKLIDIKGIGPITASRIIVGEYD